MHIAKQTGRVFVTLIMAGVLLPACSAKAEPQTTGDDARARDWGGPPIWPPYEKLELMLRLWAEQHPGIMTLEKLGASSEGRTVYAATLTDPQADADQKEHVLITALHSGLERCASTTVMSIIEWLLSGDGRAREILRRQLVVCMPVPDPDRYVQGEFSPLYSNQWSPEGHRQAAKLPEAKYVQEMMDRLQPELHADVHGSNLGFERYISFESSRGPNPGLYPYPSRKRTASSSGSLAAAPIFR
jgi:hypothetical protein